MRLVAPRVDPVLAVRVEREHALDRVGMGVEERLHVLAVLLRHGSRTVVNLAARIVAHARFSPVERPVAVRVDSVTALTGSGAGLAPVAVVKARVFVAIGIDRRSDVNVNGVQQRFVRRRVAVD